VLAEGVAAVAAVAATTHIGTSGRRAGSGTAWGSSCTRPGARVKATTRPALSAIMQGQRRASDGAIAATRAAKRLTSTPLRRSGVLFAAPAAFWWARMEVPSRKAVPGSTRCFCVVASSRSHTPSRDQRV
jgi:hypothetical protein